MLSPYKRFLLGLSAACVAVFAACGGLTDPTLPASARQFSPPAVYSRWWTMTEACSGISGSLSSVSWFEIPGEATFPFNGDLVNGYWSGGSNRIVLGEDAVLDGGTVRHEMLHALVRTSGHRRVDFLDACGGVVVCAAPCVNDAGPPATLDPSVVTVPADSLQIGVDVIPEAPSSAIDGGFFTITVTARNPSTHPVYVQLFPDASRPFLFDIQGSAGRLVGGELTLDPGMPIFRAGQMKRQVFDFRIGNDLFSRALPAGTYTLKGSFGGNSVSHAPIVVGP
jgi:hypothetical protein